jgi:cyclopropane fatty-acyl-phospholipid synthase-like methyltransferase
MSVPPGFEGLDTIALANAKARGKRPYFFRDPDVERVLSITMALAMEHAVTRQRLDALERLLEARGVLSRAELESFRPDATSEAERTRWMQEYIARVLRIVHQESEAVRRAAEGVDPPVEDVADELRHS